MAREAKCGVMLCDGRSKGTLHNVLNLIGAGKKVLIYFSPEKAFYKLSTPHDLDSLLARCDHREIQRLQNSLATLTSHAAAQLPLHPRQQAAWIPSPQPTYRSLSELGPSTSG
jgi:hypothetical protein